MTPTEKAKELVDKFRPMMYCYVGSEMLTNTFNEQEQIRNAKQCAIICADEVINYTLSEKKAELAMIVSGIVFPSHWREYWEDVKKEIEKL